MTDKEELRRLAQAATPGPWEKGTIVGLQFPIVCCAMDGIRLNVAHVAGIRNGEGLNNAAFIAAANPAVVLELLDEIERLRAEVERLQQDASRYQFIRASGAYVEPSDNSLYVALDERGKYYDDLRDLDMDIDEAIAAQRGE